MSIDTVTDLPGRLRELRALLRRLAPPAAPAGSESGRLAAGAADRLDRDLLPRTAGGAAHLVVGIVGPNNAGKSALFNALVGRVVSPSRPTGGATRRLVGAARPELFERLEAEPTLARFPLRRATPGPEGVSLAEEQAADAAELLLVTTDTLGDGVLLVDAPDFDSILAENRRASEALLRVADLVVVVVTRHTYQNREVVEFLEAWLAHERPWLLAYNESIAPEVTVEHAVKLAADVGVAPVATFHAAFDLGVADGTRPLVARALAGAPAALAVAEGTRLERFLRDLPQVAELKRRALAASLGGLRDDLRALATALDAERSRARELLDRARGHARSLGELVAGKAMPMGPFLEAFRAVLDRRPSLLQRGLRGAVRRVRVGAERLLARLPARRGDGSVAPRGELVEVERRAVEDAWAPFFEALAADLDPARATTRDGAAPDADLARDLAAELAPDASRAARARAVSALSADPEVLRAFREACEALIEEELAARGNEWFFQLAVDAVHVLPAVAAGVVILKTGGLGADVAVGGAGALTTLLAERLSRLLGTSVAWRARQRWTELRGARIAEVVLAAALERSAARLARRVEERGEIARELAALLRRIEWESAGEEAGWVAR